MTLDRSVREIAVSKLKLREEQLQPSGAGLRLREGLEPSAVHESILKQAGYEIGVHLDPRANGTGTNPFRLGRYGTSRPYPARTFDLVLSGACDLISVKDTVAGTHARRLFNQALGTSTR